MWRSFNDSAPDGQIMRMVMLTYETVVPLSFDSYTCQNFDIQKVYSIQFLNYMFICLCDFCFISVYNFVCFNSVSLELGFSYYIIFVHDNQLLEVVYNDLVLFVDLSRRCESWRALVNILCA